jgi:hypothetical protein
VEYLNSRFHALIKRLRVRSLFFTIPYVDGNNEDLILVKNLDLLAVLFIRRLCGGLAGLISNFN